MDITTIGGIIFGIALMAFAVISTEGIEGVKAFWDLPAFLLVFGGTFAALSVNFPYRGYRCNKSIKKVLRAEEEDTSEIITTFVKFSHKSRTEGFLSLEEDIKTLKMIFEKRNPACYRWI